MATVRRPAGVSAADWNALIDLAEEFRDAQQRIHDGLEHLAGAPEPNESACELAALFVRAVLPPVDTGSSTSDQEARGFAPYSREVPGGA